MDKTSKVVIFGIFILFILNITNLIFTIIVYQKSSNKENWTVQALPDKIDSEKENIIDNIVKYWNDEKIEQLYGLLGDVAKRDVSFQDFEKQAANLLSLGHLANPFYMGFRYEGKYKEYDAYDLIYNVSVGNKDGRLIISVIDLGSDFEILGFNLSKTNTS